MGNGLQYEDVKIGSSIPFLAKHPSTRQEVRWAGATEAFHEIHYDKDFAQSHGLPGVVVHGGLLNAFLAEMLSKWVGDDGYVRKMASNYRGMALVGENVTCRGIVTKKYGFHFVECQVWVENPKKEKIVEGTAVVFLAG
jgi:acyl dehydratase